MSSAGRAASFLTLTLPHKQALLPPQAPRRSSHPFGEFYAMSLESCTESIKNRIGEDSGIDATIKFDFGEQGKIHVDALSKPNLVSNEDKEAQCTIGVELADFESMLAGELDPTAAFMSGKLRVEGDMGVVMKLQSIM